MIKVEINEAGTLAEASTSMFLSWEQTWQGQNWILTQNPVQIERFKIALLQLVSNTSIL